MAEVLITGSSGLVGSEAVRFFLDKGCAVVGVDNNMRKEFFGEAGDVSGNIVVHKDFVHFDKDICDSSMMIKIMNEHKPELIIHAAAQPSHDWAVSNPRLDFKVNAEGTLCLLEAYRKYSPKATFIFVSTNKVYGNTPNLLGIAELTKRYEVFSLPNGIDESMSVDNSLHSLFGVSKLSADLLVQEYGKYFGLYTGVFRCGCITGPRHAGVQLHGFLSYMAKCKGKYKVFGYKGKQVRDNIHAFDLVNAFYHYSLKPRCGEVYNMGGGRHSNISVLEALEMFGLDYNYVDEPRIGDHIWWISDVSKFRSHCPDWNYKYNILSIINELNEKTTKHKTA